MVAAVVCVYPNAVPVVSGPRLTPDGGGAPPPLLPTALVLATAVPATLVPATLLPATLFPPTL
eukprot:10157900-Lingulodinium_polyedra.AAC.1